MNSLALTIYGRNVAYKFLSDFRVFSLRLGLDDEVNCGGCDATQTGRALKTQLAEHQQL